MAEEVLDLTLSDDDDGQDLYPPAVAAAASAARASVKREQQSRAESAARPASPTRSAPKFNNDGDSKATIVSGKGVWKSWTRSFKNTLLKLLDIVDNSVDGATVRASDDGGDGTPRGDFTGRVHVQPDVHAVTKTNRRGKLVSIPTTTGLRIRNNSPSRIVPLSEALVVYSTSKLDAGEIGENGVGLKQACAALCDLSFVLVWDGTGGSVELGIIAKDLQREEGPYLPAFQFLHDGSDDGDSSLKEQMVALFSRSNHSDVAQCIAQYGAEATDGDPSLDAGIDVLCRRFDDMRGNFYGNDHVFEVILNRIRDGQNEGVMTKGAVDAQQKITVNQLVTDLQQVIPKTYLHIPADFEFIVGDEELRFNFWTERLVEMSTFTVMIGTTIPWKQNFEVSDEHPDAYPLRLFLGFDRQRIANPDVEADTGERTDGKNASLHFYSRQSGRLIKSEHDARQMLGLTSGSSSYGAALTIIVDDFNGKLPLHPTKQDISFGLESKGAVHEENLIAWVSSITKFYYNYHLHKYKDAKKVLTAKVSHYVDSKKKISMKSYAESSFTTFELTFEKYRDTIRVDKSLAKEIVGKDTCFRLHPEGHENKKAAGKKRARENQLESKSAKQQQPATNGTKATPKRKRSQSSRTNAKKPKSKPPSEEGDAKAGKDTIDVKMESGTFDDCGMVDLCESSDEEASSAEIGLPATELPMPNAASTSATEEVSGQRDTIIKQMAESNGQSCSSNSEKVDATRQTFRSNDADKGKVRELERVIKRLKEEYSESQAAIALLETENDQLKEQLSHKEGIISVLKRRLGAGDAPH